MRTVLVLALLAPAASAFAGGAWPPAPSDIGSAPWADVASSPAFAPEDAYLFSDPSASHRLDPDAEAAAYLVDRERMAEQPAVAAQSGTGRVGLAFADFVAYGPDGLSYASAALARAGGGAVRVALATPSMATFALAAR